MADYIKGCDSCQKHLSMTKKVKEELKNIVAPSEVMKQIGVNTVQKQKDSSSCGLFAIAFATNI